MPLPQVDRQPGMVCPLCGSTFFYTVRAERFAAGGYGTAEFRSLTNAPKTVHICLCGHPITPKPQYHARGTSSDLDEVEFRKSVEASQKYIKSNSIQNVAKVAASPDELQELRDKLTVFGKTIEPLLVKPVEDLKTSIVHERPKPKTSPPAPRKKNDRVQRPSEENKPGVSTGPGGTV